MANPERCPYCSGTNGVHTREVVKFNAFYGWDGDHIESQLGDLVSGGSRYYCCDCGRDVTRHIEVTRVK